MSAQPGPLGLAGSGEFPPRCGPPTRSCWTPCSSSGGSGRDGLRIVGIDEDTALVHTTHFDQEGAGGVWEVHPDGVRQVDRSTLPTPS